MIFVTAVLVAGSAAASGSNDGLDLGTGFTFQGELNQHGTAADGLYDFVFELYDSPEGGEFLGNIARFDQPVSSGIFSAELDFGQSITGTVRWLEIHVREAGGGTFTVMSPRQRLAKSTTTACTVDSDLVVNGNIGSKAEHVGFLDASGAELMGFGRYEFFGLDYLTLRTSNTDQVYLSGGGNLGIGTPPTVPLDVVGGTDASLGGGGFFVVGPQDGRNIVMDSNEIMARNNTAASTLYLNNDGGDVVTGSDLDVGGNLSVTGDLAVVGGLNFGYQIVEAQCGGNQNWCTATCPTGKKVISGGCHTSSGGVPPINASYPLSTTEWHCVFQTAVPNASLFHAQAVCARIP